MTKPFWATLIEGKIFYASRGLAGKVRSKFPSDNINVQALKDHRNKFTEGKSSSPANPSQVPLLSNVYI